MLDVQATEDLWTKLIELWEDQTVVIVEHKVKHIWNHVDRVILMDYNGNIIADECPEIILQKYVHLLSEYGVWHPEHGNSLQVVLTFQQQTHTYYNLKWTYYSR